MSVTWDWGLPVLFVAVFVAGAIVGAYSWWVWTGERRKPDPIPTGQWTTQPVTGDWIIYTAAGEWQVTDEFAGGAGTGNGRESRPTPRPYDWETDG